MFLDFENAEKINIYYNKFVNIYFFYLKTFSEHEKKKVYIIINVYRES